MPRPKGGSTPPSKHLLRPLFRDKKIETLFVTTAGVGTKPTSDWTDEAGNLWLTGIQTPGIGLFSYEHGIGSSDTGFWHSLLDHGQHLLMSIIVLVESQHLQHCPIILIGHSLGGFIVKETLRLAYERTEQQYNSFKKSLAGVILMGTPHSISEEEEKWQKIALLPQVASLGFKAQSLDKDTIRNLAQSSLAFDQGGVVCPILTVCEKRETKLKQFFGSKKIKLVERDFARTGSRDEEIIEVDSNHRNLCKVSHDTRVQTFIATALEDARLRIANNSPLSGVEIDELDEHGYDLMDVSSNPTTSHPPLTSSATAGSSGLGFELIPMMSNVKLESTRLPCYSIPVAQNKDFYGRQDIIDKMDAFFLAPGIPHRKDGDASRSFALCGPGGMGKTQIVTEYVHRCKKAKIFDAIFWIYADKPSKVSDGIAQIAISLDLVAAESNEALDPVITTNLTKEWLSNPARFIDATDEQHQIQPTWLLVLDNVDDVQVVEGFWPIEGPGCILITSRDPLAKESSVLADTGYDVESFSSEESSLMLEMLTKREGNGRAVGDRLGGLPLAIAQMASVIIRNHMSFEEFVDAWDENKEHPEYLGYDKKPGHLDGYGKNLSTAWAIESLRHGKPLLEIIAFFDPDGIQEVILKQYSAITLDEYPTAHSAYLKARKELIQTSLVAKDRTEKSLCVHRMVQDVTRSKMSKENYHKVFTAAVRLLVQAWPFEEFGWRHGVARWRKCEEMFPHVLSLKGYGSRVIEAVDNTDTKIEYCRLMNDAGWYYHETGHFVESQALIGHSQSVAEATKLTLSKVTTHNVQTKNVEKQLATLLAETHHNLGCIGTESNQPEFTLSHFSAFNEMMVAEIDDHMKKTDNRLAISWNELGNAFMMNKMWVEGERCFKECLEVAQQMTSFAPAEFSFPYVNLGLAYWLTERFVAANDILEEGLRYRVAAFGHDDRQSFITGRFLYALGNVAASQGGWNESLAYHERALRQFLSTIGKNHHRTGDIRVKLTEHYIRLGSLKEACVHIDEALRIFSERVIFRPEFARAMFWKSKLLEASGDSDEARKLWGKSVQMYLEITHRVVQGNIEPSAADFDGVIAFWSR
ncbi:uncharacterized protein K460DRAFT_24339 [Cucurbitaria berberidis CBS 394.84]|uniref:DUF7779 domain-containing protein n=1 Tax=Cucurbitaria berberidis CBS 394.84 TaxID=1168544 RepID=A0A9P4GTT5_9PLEO|nr:uncharacterized protein K460DRAFT_24339 [Cucurbitaria berberidis CBS 394.84]KAF1850931.1 hypothetical protein K460DRAFT_24339 [Cucurbitaria berberidis CBS 394.84]